MENAAFSLDEFTEDELIEIFASMWLGMDLDFNGFKLLDETQRSTSSARFIQLNGLRYAILVKIANRFKGTDKHDDIQAILDSAGEIMFVARGGAV